MYDVSLSAFINVPRLAKDEPKQMKDSKRVVLLACCQGFAAS